MDQVSIYEDIARRTDGNIYIGVVGPVRTGKSTFIKRFMETIVLPNVDSDPIRERARDELPQSGSGRTIMTVEPKFVPESAVSVSLAPDVSASVRLIDSVGYMIPGAAGQFDEGGERLVTTPWFDHEIPMSQAAEEGTRKVICEHSTIGIVVTTDGSITDISRDDYVGAERRVVAELKNLQKPFLVLLNSTAPASDQTQNLANALREELKTTVIPVNCKTMSEDDIRGILQQILLEFPIKEINFCLPSWLDALPHENETKRQMLDLLLQASESLDQLRDAALLPELLIQSELIEDVQTDPLGVAEGKASFRILCPRALYYQIISAESGTEVHNDGELIELLRKMSEISSDYQHIQSALRDVRETGYGVVPPNPDDLQLEEPEIVRKGGRYGVCLRASGSTIHMLRANVVAEIHPELGGEDVSGEILGFLLQGFQGDARQLWESGIFGASLYDMVQEELNAKAHSMPPKAAGKLQETVQKIINDGGGTLLCIIL